ncbi:TMEM175 family protein [Hymenobacter sp. YC55]|uniref:TMEM175 family protein n=1 Tax=Hymenobacter sp. YC55 TaxID=3034019 RepID=UPI0023F8800A|nr:TMEM175 family protein [Hymenobacter sp. YC55]MDF7813891.1 TMEM175 family protein [Hymenobacter sp. YC55]
MHNHRPTDRLEYFSDAVLAIAATLLATELPKPETETGLLQEIVKQWPHYAAFAASFLFICIAWSNHHNMFIYIKKTDQYLLILNILFLLFVTLQSFTTGLLAIHVGKPDERTAALIYHGTLVLMTFFYNCLWWYAIRNSELMEDDIDKRLIRLLTKEYAIAPALHLAALLICLWSVPFSIIPVLLLYIYFALPRLSEKRMKQQNPTQG